MVLVLIITSHIHYERETFPNRDIGNSPLLPNVESVLRYTHYLDMCLFRTKCATHLQYLVVACVTLLIKLLHKQTLELSLYSQVNKCQIILYIFDMPSNRK
jgi:hypothetical protein